MKKDVPAATAVVTWSAFEVAPFGWLLLGATKRGLAAVELTPEGAPTDDEAAGRLSALISGARLTREGAEPHPVLSAARKALQAYFSHGAPLSGVPRDVISGTAFERAVWEALARIPFGETRTYGEIAREVGRPRAFRAVGRACGKNPLLLLVPCHRVVAGSGGLGGFSSGLPVKRALLDHEARGKPPA